MPLQVVVICSGFLFRLSGPDSRMTAQVCTLSGGQSDGDFMAVTEKNYRKDKNNVKIKWNTF